LHPANSEKEKSDLSTLWGGKRVGASRKEKNVPQADLKERRFEKKGEVEHLYKPKKRNLRERKKF